MRIYLAGRFSDRVFLCPVRERLVQMGHAVVSHWLDRVDAREPERTWGDSGYAVECAQEDWADLLGADWVILSTETNSPDTRGGRYVELGIALEWGMRIGLVGPRTNVFTYLPEVEWFATWGKLLDVASQSAPLNKDHQPRERSI